MKPTKTFFYLLTICCTLMSCNRISPDLQDELNMQVAELSTFLNDNYTIGDSVYFQNWPSKKGGAGVVKGFVVTENYTKEFSKTIVGIEDAEGLFCHLDGCKLVVVLQGGEDKLTIELTCAIEDKRLIYSWGTFLINDMKDEGYNSLGTKSDIKTIKWEYAWCELQKNVGITYWINFDYDSIYSNLPTYKWKLVK